MADGVFNQKYFVSNFGKLFIGKESPEPNLWTEIDYDTFKLLLDVAKMAWNGYYDIYDYKS